MGGLNRREALSAGALAAAASAVPTAALAQGTAAPAVVQESVSDRIQKRARENVHAISFDGRAFTGPGWELLVREGRDSRHFLIGEEHGTAEIPVLTASLFEALRPAGYNRLAIEISAPVAEDMDHAARAGLPGIEAYCREYRPGPAFFNWKHEAELLARVRAMVPGKDTVFWGLDYEVIGDRQLIARLKAKTPASARAAVAALDRVSAEGYAAWTKTGDPGRLPMFGLDPALAHAVRETWPSPDTDSAIIIDVLIETLEINRLQQSSGWASNKRRADFNRRTLVRLMQEEGEGGSKALFKMGSTHMMRGVSWTGVFDIGSLAAEEAALRGEQSFHLLVGGGADSRHGVTNPVDLSVNPMPADMLRDAFGLGLLLDALPTKGLWLLDLRPLRSIASSKKRLTELNNPEAVRVIHGFDALLCWNGTTATVPLV